jgi:hypothetical protein
VASDLVDRLEQNIDRLLARVRSLEQANALQAKQIEGLVTERALFAGELDAILAKLDRLERGAP